MQDFGQYFCVFTQFYEWSKCILYINIYNIVYEAQKSAVLGLESAVI
jgi:hypothetical protein